MDGTPFGRYRLVELLGRGGMGKVWRAHDTETDRIVAIKLLPAFLSDLSDDEEFKHRFRREAHAAARLNDPHVIPIHNYGEIDNQLYVDMRLIDGRDLQTALAEGPLDPARAVRIIEQLAMALHAAHKVGLLHRDIKPSNILLDDNDFAYLIDFGIARAIDETRMTKSGDTIGTFQYIAPERLDARADEDARADIYSLACVLYESLTVEPPFPGSTTAHLVTAHLNAPPPRPSTIQPDVPPAVDDVIATGMAKDPNQRYAATIELANAATDAITAPIAQASQIPPTTAAFAANTAASMPVTELAAQAYVVDPIPVTTQHGPVPETPTPQLAPWWRRQRRPVQLGLIVASVVILAVGTGIAGYVLRPHSPASSTRAAQPSTATHIPPPPTPAGPSPVAEGALDGLLLSPVDVNTAMGANGMMVVRTLTAMGDNSADVPDKACRPIGGPLLAPVYADSGWSAFREQVLREPGTTWTHLTDQGVAVFHSAHEAGAFFDSSAQNWPACANRQFIKTVTGRPDIDRRARRQPTAL